MIKKVEQNDLPRCAEVIRKSFMTVAEEFGITEENGARFTAFATTLERLSYHLEIERRPMFACFENDEIVGYYSLLLSENGECELNNLCVLPEYRHSGIGERLLRHAFEQAVLLRCVRMNIGIVEENKVLRQWYMRFGFEHTGTRKFDFFPFICGYMSKTL